MTKKPVESFGPHLLAFLREAALGRIELPVPSEREAMRLRSRIHSLRAQMRRTQHPLAGEVLRAKLIIEKGSWGVRLVGHPQDQEFESLFEAAGISPKEVDDLNLSHLEQQLVQMSELEGKASGGKKSKNKKEY